MKTYLVGGAIRDQLLGLSVQERDWVVVGSTPDEMLSMGFQPVGKDFPVFLHPKTHEEYALARTERKVEKGYKGFVFHTDHTVSLEEDLKRRDLTINAIAQDEDGKLIDPYQGQADLEAKVLRHISPAFLEDPVRLLRVARFAAKLPEFQIADETMMLMQSMVQNGEVDALVPERVWQECRKALGEIAPSRFFSVLMSTGALTILLPGIRQQQIDVLTDCISSLETPETRFAALCQSMDHADLMPMLKHYRISKPFQELAVLANRFLNDYKMLLEADSAAILSFIQSTDAIRRRDRFTQLAKVLNCLLHLSDSLQRKLIQTAVGAIAAIDAASLKKAHPSTEDFLIALHQEKIAAIDAAKSSIR